MSLKPLIVYLVAGVVVIIALTSGMVGPSESAINGFMPVDPTAYVEGQ